MNLVLWIGMGAGLLCWLLLFASDRSWRRQRRRQPKAASAKNMEELVDYSAYRMNAAEKAVAWLQSGSLLFVIGYVFYHNTLVAFCFFATGFINIRLRAGRLRDKRKWLLAYQFHLALGSLSASLSAGRSIENAFRESLADLEMLFPSQGTSIMAEWRLIHAKLVSGESMESALLDFARRSDHDDIRSFCDVLIACKRTGGNLVEVIRRTVMILGDKMTIGQEISVSVAQKKFESRVLSVAPITILALLGMSTPDYLQPLYQGMIGPLIMTAALVILVLCYCVSAKITDIKV